MKTRLLLASLAAAFGLWSCGDDSSTGSSGSGGIEPALVGTWVHPNLEGFQDTLIFASSGRYLVPWCSGTGSGLQASGGRVSCPASQDVCGEYVLSHDTLFYEGLLGSEPDGVVPRAATNTFLRIP